MRTEKDALGAMELPDDAYYGIQAARAAANFDATDLTFNDFPNVVAAVAEVKKACAMANQDIGALDPAVADAVIRAADEIIRGQMAGQFPVNIWRGGGTSVNMNVNEVIANRANEILTGKKGFDRVHPNDHVNMCQSSNDVFPTAEQIVLYREIGRVAEAALAFERALEDKAREFATVVRLGRTAMQDGVPMTLGQAFIGFRGMIRRNRKLLEAHRDACRVGVLGGTITGTGLGALPGYAERVYPRLGEVTGINMVPASSSGPEIIADEALFDAMQNADSLIVLSAYCKALACAGGKIANDFRLLSSGPRAGLGEITLPAVSPGSSIMPGKINPFMCDLMVQVMHQVAGNDWGVTMNVAVNELDLAFNSTVAFFGLLQSMEMLRNSMLTFTENCVKGITANEATCREYAEKSTSLATVASALFGYEVGTRIAEKCLADDSGCKRAAVDEKLFKPEVAEELFDVDALADRKKSAALFGKYGTLRKAE